MRFDGRLALPVLGPIHAVGHWAITGVQAHRGLEPKWPNPAVVACTAQATRPVSRFILRIPPEALLPPPSASLSLSARGLTTVAWLPQLNAHRSASSMLFSRDRNPACPPGNSVSSWLECHRRPRIKSAAHLSKSITTS
jgi:hypothetical protein